ncbi:MAG: serine/threonine-protein kinase RsbW [Solirubrobacteraceae bacterium]|nr:serine/threonine-protein kinase RsbW [Solirubrobacteraceae bacterium]
MTDVPEVTLRMPARPENVAVVRQALGGLANVLGIDGALLDDMKLAITEACTNVVVHAYGGGGGPLAVEMHPAADTLTLVVSDEGEGIRPRLNPESSSALGLGLPLMAALSDDFEIRGDGEHGTTVRMTFSLAPAAAGSED